MRFLRTFPILAAFLLKGSIGAEYGVGVVRKAELALRFWLNHRRLATLSDVIEHVELAAAILSVPPALEGVLVECGCYRGGSTANLSLVADLVGRRLVVFDSFEGLPEPAEHDREHPAPFSHHVDLYEQGRFAASLDSVRENLRRFGKLEVCDFVAGYFDETMPRFDSPTVCAFLDVDLVDSLTPCLAGIWPRLRPGCRIYLHEAQSLQLAAVFFDAPWWETTLGTQAPGLIGAGTGLPLAAGIGSQLGYALKPS